MNTQALSIPKRSYGIQLAPNSYYGFTLYANQDSESAKAYIVANMPANVNDMPHNTIITMARKLLLAWKEELTRVAIINDEKAREAALLASKRVPQPKVRVKLIQH